jgi:hypothetical protein
MPLTEFNVPVSRYLIEAERTWTSQTERIGLGMALENQSVVGPQTGWRSLAVRKSTSVLHMSG